MPGVKMCAVGINGGRGVVGRFVFGLVFVAVGLLFFMVMFVNPRIKAKEAKTWESVSAVVMSSEVKSHRSDDSTTYSVYIAYQYEFDGQQYLGDRYSFMGGSSSGYPEKAQIVDQYPAGRVFSVFVNPDDPSESVIMRDAGNKWIGLIPLVFVAAGAVVMVRFGRKGITACDPSQSLQATVLLKERSRVGKFVGMLVFALVWNGAVIFMFRSAEVPVWFASVFGAIGLLALSLCIHAFLGIFNPVPVVEMCPGAIYPGTDVAMRWRLNGRIDRIAALSIRLRCQHVVTERHRRGGKTEHRVVRSTLFETDLVNAADQASIAQGALRFRIPEDQPASRPGTHDGIEWHILFCGEIARWPDLQSELAFTVYPRD